MDNYITKTIHYTNKSDNKCESFFAITKATNQPYKDNKLNKYELIPFYNKFCDKLYKSIGKDFGCKSYIISNSKLEIYVYMNSFTIYYKDSDNDIVIKVCDYINNKWDEKYNTYMKNMKYIPSLNDYLDITKSFNDIVKEKVHGELINLIKKELHMK